MNYIDIINHYPDFPKPGIDFIDIIPFLSNKEAFQQLISDIDNSVHCPNVVTVEARGFFFAAPLLTQSKLVRNVVPIRKKGKLPYAKGDLRDVEIMKEYGPDLVYYRLSDIAAGVPEGDTFYLTFFDDILATGGTSAIRCKRILYRGWQRIQGQGSRVHLPRRVPRPLRPCPLGGHSPD